MNPDIFKCVHCGGSLTKDSIRLMTNNPDEYLHQLTGYWYCKDCGLMYKFKEEEE